MNIFTDVVIPFLHYIVHTLMQDTVRQHIFDETISKEKKTRYS